MASTYKLLALDLDGTLTDSSKRISRGNREAIAAAQRAGVGVVLASGRPLIGIKPVAEALRLYDEGGYILAYNGGHIVDCAEGTDLVKRTIPTELFHQICTINRRFRVCPLSYSDTGVLCEDDTSLYVQKEGYNNSVPVIRVESLEHALKEPVVKFMVVGEPEELEKAADYLRLLYHGLLNIFFSEPYFLEITPQGIEKASALKHLCRILKVKREELMACGDGLNDIPMLQFAGLAVAMENAYEETKRYADYITASNDEDGVARAIRRYIL